MDEKSKIDLQKRVEWDKHIPAEMLDSEEFQKVYDCIKNWDINVPSIYGGYCAATGNHVRAILTALNYNYELDHVIILTDKGYIKDKDTLTPFSDEALVYDSKYVKTYDAHIRETVLNTLAATVVEIIPVRLLTMAPPVTTNQSK